MRRAEVIDRLKQAEPAIRALGRARSIYSGLTRAMRPGLSRTSMSSSTRTPYATSASASSWAFISSCRKCLASKSIHDPRRAGRILSPRHRARSHPGLLMAPSANPRARLEHILCHIQGVDHTIGSVDYDVFTTVYHIERAVERAVQIISEAVESVASESESAAPGNRMDQDRRDRKHSWARIRARRS